MLPVVHLADISHNNAFGLDTRDETKEEESRRHSALPYQRSTIMYLLVSAELSGMRSQIRTEDSDILSKCQEYCCKGTPLSLPLQPAGTISTQLGGIGHMGTTKCVDFRAAAECGGLFAAQVVRMAVRNCSESLHDLDSAEKLHTSPTQEGPH